jgi:hypothetical protein
MPGCDNIHAYTRPPAAAKEAGTGGLRTHSAPPDG